MRNAIVALAVLCCGTAFAQNKPAAPAAPPAAPAQQQMAKPPETAAPPANAMANWKPPKVTNADKKGVDALYKDCEEAMKKGDFASFESKVDFPVFMVTDSSAGATMAEAWPKEKWSAMMKPSFENMPKDSKMTTKHKPEFISDNLVSVVEEHTMTMGKQKHQWKSASLLVKKDGKWMFKMMAEGGWGDVMAPKGASLPMMDQAKTAQK
jgi:hypothetical protein